MKKESPFIFIPNNNFENKTQLFIDHTGLLIYQPIPTNVEWKDCIYQHLYILSNDEIKDVQYTRQHPNISTYKGEYFLHNEKNILGKIIATTNPELWESINTQTGIDYKIGIPSISQSDIEYIMSLHNWNIRNEEIGKIPAYESGLTAEETRAKDYIEKSSEKYAKELIAGGAIKEWQEGWMKDVYKYIYNQCLLDNADKKFTLEEVKELMEQSAYYGRGGSKCLDNLEKWIEGILKSLIKEQKK